MKKHHMLAIAVVSVAVCLAGCSTTYKITPQPTAVTTHTVTTPDVVGAVPASTTTTTYN
jgi:outer membrane protein assembly factor BamE (lipoprotein component of BamABCDE complex)